MDYGSSKKGGSGSFGSAGDIPGGGKTSPFDEKCLGSGKGGDMGKNSGGGAGNSYPGIK